MGTTPPQVLDESETVFRGTIPACVEMGLVLEAKGISYRLVNAERMASLRVLLTDAATASDELTRYAAERTERPPSSITFVPFTGGVAGAAIYASILIGVAYCAGNQTFGLDWFDRGALNSSVGVASQWWRSITALTLHASQEHLFGNLLFGAWIGILNARMFGAGVSWLSILVCAAVANYADMLLSPASHRAIGASTAVFATLGMLSGFGWGQRVALRDRTQRLYRWGPLFGGVFLLAYLGAGDAHVDVLAHFLGFSTGVIAGWRYARAALPRNRSKALQLATGFLAISVILFAWRLALQVPG